MTNFTPTDRTKVRRKPDRGSYDRELIYSILDEAFVCQVGFISDGLPFVVPTNYVRVGDKLFLHGSTASRLMKTLASGAPFCLSVTLLDGIVLSPTATGHSVNYRSVVVMGKAEPVEGEEKERGLRIQNIDDNALPKDAAQFDARGILRKIEKLLAAQFLYAQIDQICRAEILHGAESAR
jgi:nitroimidazol reductase NimA-like FMN-containing flavoprotein (pyridoxamine 5'-phosphate oxidase superfamily)